MNVVERVGYTVDVKFGKVCTDLLQLYYAHQVSGIMRLFRKPRGITEKIRRGREGRGVDVMEFG